MHPSPKTHPHDNLAVVLHYIRTTFYNDHENHYHRDRSMLLYALTWPAAWLHKHALKPTPEHYQNLLLEQLHQIHSHGNPALYNHYFPRYLLKCLQHWIQHHHEKLYNELKHLSYTLDQITAQIENNPTRNHTAVLAQAHEILRQNYRKKHTNHPPQQRTFNL